MDLKKLQERLGYCFKNAELLKSALTHLSYAGERGLGYNYEKLEFLGDSIVNYLLVDLLYEHFARLPVGKLALIKGFLISEEFLARLADRLGLEEFILVSRDEEQRGRRSSAWIKADVFEALWAALYLDSESIDFVRRLFRRHFEGEVVDAVRGGDFYRDYKTLLQEITQKRFKTKPSYRLVEESGPSHERTFTVECSVGELKTLGSGRTKKEAEQRAAERMVREHFGEQFSRITGGGFDRPPKGHK